MGFLSGISSRHHGLTMCLDLDDVGDAHDLGNPHIKSYPHEQGISRGVLAGKESIGNTPGRDDLG